MLSVLPVVLMLGPPLLLALIVLLLPMMRVLGPALVGTMLLMRWLGDAQRHVHDNTPSALRCVIWIRKQRRHLRAIRFAGLREIRTAHEPPPEPSLWERVCLWAPVTVVAVAGQLLGLGSPHYPPPRTSRRRLEGGQDEAAHESPRKRKQPDGDEASASTSSGDASSSDSSSSSASDEGELEDLEDLEELEDPLEYLLRERRAGVLQGAAMAFARSDDALSPILGADVRTGADAGAGGGGAAQFDERRRSLLFRMVYPLPSEDSENDPDFEPGAEIEDTDDEDEGDDENTEIEPLEVTLVAAVSSPSTTKASLEEPQLLTQQEHSGPAGGPSGPAGGPSGPAGGHSGPAGGHSGPLGVQSEPDEGNSSSSSTLTAGGDPSGGSSGDDAREDKGAVTRSVTVQNSDNTSNASTATGNSATEDRH